MSADNKDDQTIVNFDALNAEEGDGGDGSPTDEQKLKDTLAFLKEKLEPADYGKVLESFGVQDEMSNAELFAAIKALVKPDEGGDDDPDAVDDKDKDKEKDAGGYKDFMKKCMEGGKPLKECGEEYKEKYPEPAPKDEEIAEVEQLAKKMLEDKEKDLGKEDPKDKVIKDMELRLKKLEEDKTNAGVAAKVDDLIKDQHLAPVQRDQIIKLAAKLGDDDQGELLEFFRTTMKLSAFQDVGHLGSTRPGATGGTVLTPERKQELIKTFGLDGLIDDKADLSSVPWRKHN